MRALERYLLLQIIDERWREHLYDMDYLREGIHLRGFAQIDPLVAYKNEAFDAVQRPDELDLVRLRADDLPRRGRGRGRPTATRPQQYAPAVAAARRAPARLLLRRRRGAPAERAAAAAAAGAGAEGATRRGAPEPVQQRRVDEAEQIGRNDPCWCGSGKKFKKCHGAVARAA